MRVTSIVVIVSSLSSFYYCNAESTPNKNRVVHQNNNEEEAYTLYPDLNEERPSRRQLQDKSMATASPSYYPTLSPTFESMSMQAAARNAEDQHDAAMLNVNPPKKKAAPKKKNAPKSSKTKSSKSTSCTSSKSSKSSSSRSGRSSRSSRCSKSSKSNSSSRSGRRIEPPADASIHRSPDHDTYEYDSEDGSI